MRLTIKLNIISFLFLFLLAGTIQAYAADVGFCRRYARIAVDVQKQQKKLRCGYWGTAWHTNYNTHYNWCRRQSQKTAWSHHVWRSKKLSQCKNKYATGTSCVCRPGGDMRVKFTAASWHNQFILYFRKANHTATQRLPAPGYCALTSGRWRRVQEEGIWGIIKGYWGMSAELKRGRWHVEYLKEKLSTVNKVMNAIRNNRTFNINIFYDERSGTGYDRVRKYKSRYYFSDMRLPNIK